MVTMQFKSSKYILFTLFLSVSGELLAGLGYDNIELLHDPPDSILVEGSNATLRCIFDGPIRDCHWIKDGCCSLEIKDRFKISGNLEEGDCSLTISPVHRRDQGSWQCSSKSLGIYSTRARVTVQSVNDMPNNVTELEILKHPENQTVIENDSVLLECEFNGPAQSCFWMKEGDTVSIEGKYSYIGERSQGNCSIIITKIGIDDAGLWRCGYPKRIGRAASALKSKIANLTIGVTPEDPVIVFDGIRLKNGHTFYVSSLQTPTTLWCFSERGNPPATLRWKIEDELLDSYGVITKMKDSDVFADSLHHSLWIKRLRFFRYMSPLWNNKNLYCEAEHPLYGQKHKVAHIRLIVPKIELNQDPSREYYG